MKLRKGDKVIVIAGKDKGRSSTIVRVLPVKNKIVLDGLNLVKRHRRATQSTRKGQIVDKSMPIHISNVMLMDPKSGKPTRVKILRTDGTYRRVSVKSGEQIK